MIGVCECGDDPDSFACFPTGVCVEHHQGKTAGEGDFESALLMLLRVLQADVLQHDSFSCTEWGGGVPFPVARHGDEHVGQRFGEGGVPVQSDIDGLRWALKRQKSECKALGE